MTHTETDAKSTSTGIRSGLVSALKLVFTLVAVVIVVVMLWFLDFGQAIVGDANKRNQRDLAIAASGLETWSDAVKSVAIGNFIRGRVEPLEDGSRDRVDGWTHQSRIRHPILGEYRIVFRVGTRADCSAIKDLVISKEPGLPFVRNYYAGGSKMLKILGSFPVSDIWRLDMGDSAMRFSVENNKINNDKVAAYLDDILSGSTYNYTSEGIVRPTLGTPPKPAPNDQELSVCHGVVIPLDQLLIIDRAARDFSNLLVVTDKGEIVAQIGDDEVPLRSIAGLAPNMTAFFDSLAASVGKPDLKSKQKQLTENLKPVEIDIGGKTMVAYARPFYPGADGFRACVPDDDDEEFPNLSIAVSTSRAAKAVTSPRDEAGTDEVSEATARKDKPGPPRCFVIGLMPKVAVWRQIANPPLLLVVSFGLVVGVALTLLPALRLLLLGPREAINRYEAIALVLGLPAAVSLTTLGLLYAVDMAAHRNAAHKEASRIATEAAELGGEHLMRATATAVAMSDQITVDAPTPTNVNTSKPKDDSTSFKYKINPTPVYYDIKSKKCDVKDNYSLPTIESISYFASNGVSLPNSHTLSCRKMSGGRAQLLGREYFQRVLRKDVSFSDGKTPKCYPVVIPAANPYMALTEPPTGPAYAVEQVMALPDGISKTIIAFNPANPKPSWTAGLQLQDKSVIAVASTVMSDLVTPAILPPYQMMVVDTRDRRLPVIMHPAPNRAGAERLATMLSRPEELREQLRELVADGNPAKPGSFSRLYEGGDRAFVAAPIKSSRWVVIVHYARIDIDALPSRTVQYALASWAATSVLFGLVWIGWLLFVGRRDRRMHTLQTAERKGLQQLTGMGWPRLWPQESRINDYVMLNKWLLGIAGVGLVVILIWMVFGPPSYQLLLFVLVVRGLAGVLLHWRLGGEPLPPKKANSDSGAEKPGKVITPPTQAAFSRVSVSLMLCLSVVPMIGFWWDARSLTQIEHRHHLLVEIDGHDGVREQADRGLERIRWAYGKEPGDPVSWSAKSFGYALQKTENVDKTTATAKPDQTFVAMLRAIAGRSVDDSEVSNCPDDATSAGKDKWNVMLCGLDPKGRGISVKAPGFGNLLPSGWGILGFIAILIGLAFAVSIVGLAFYTLLKRVLEALCGFSIALEAVQYPRLSLKSLWLRVENDHDKDSGGAIQTLNRKSLLVNAPWSTEKMLELLCDTLPANPPGTRRGNSLVLPERRTLRRFDLSGLEAGGDGDLPEIRVYPGDIILVTGLDLVLADAPRRLRALAALEDMVQQIDKQTTPGGETSDPYLLFLAPAAPMDRILDAYEREHPTNIAVDIKRENLRWARLFEDFATFQFRPMELTDGRLPDSVVTRDEYEKKAILTVFQELRWLSPQVVDGCINVEKFPDDKLLQKGLLPVRDDERPNESPFIELYRKPILDWAVARQFPGRKAALTYIRSQFIEHYQRLWSSSTLAERLVLHHLANGRFVNIQTSLGFGSLVRRGLVVLDPEPKLMNESFAMFVRQAEKLDRIREWQHTLPGSAWVKTRLPILGVLSLAITALAVMAALAGQDLLALVPILAAGVPALVAAVQRLFRPA